MNRRVMPIRLRVELSPNQSVTALVYSAARQQHRAGITLVLGHGAGAGQASDFMVKFADALAARGVDIITFNFLYSEQERRFPDPNARLTECYRAVIAAVREQTELAENELAIGGKSMGGRIASQVAAADADDLAGLVFLGYPLHPPGRPDRLRAKHLSLIRTPMLFVQGSRDAFGTPDELRPIIVRLATTADLYVVEGGDHSFKIPKKSGMKQEDVYCEIQDRIASWLKNLSG
jgi:predicted alpha/beta-hydrolase family hydrolase